jgi:hypothetical protein
MKHKFELTPEFHRIGLLIAVASSKERMAATGIIVGSLFRHQNEATLSLVSFCVCDVLLVD